MLEISQTYIIRENSSFELSLVASQLVYIFSPLQTNHEAIKEINTIFYKFLWNDKGDKIKRKIMINDYSEGGLKMIDIASFNKSLKATWIQKYLDPESRSKWKRLFDSELERNGGEAIRKGNLNKKQLKNIRPFCERNTCNLVRSFFPGNGSI